MASRTITDEQERRWTVIAFSTQKPSTHTRLRFQCVYDPDEPFREITVPGTLEAFSDKALFILFKHAEPVN